MRKQDKTPPRKLSDMDIGNPPGKELRVMPIKMIKELRIRMDAQSENILVFNKELESINNQTELNNTISEMKNTLEGISSRLNDAEDQISELEDRGIEITTTG